MLTMKGIRFSYGPRPVLRGVDLQVEAGEMVGLVGPNGAGKTTLLRLAGGLLRPHGGTVRLCGRDPSSLGPGQRARLVAALPQSPTVPHDFAVLDLVLLGRTAHLSPLSWEGRRDVEAALEVLRSVGLGGYEDRPLATLSGGERQLALLAMALVQEAPLLLLDEPTASLDLAHQSQVMERVADLQKERRGATLVAIHDLTLAAQYCRRIVLLADGVIVAQGPPEEALTVESVCRAYGAHVRVLAHPETGGPVIVPSPRRVSSSPCQPDPHR